MNPDSLMNFSYLVLLDLPGSSSVPISVIVCAFKTLKIYLYKNRMQ